MNNRFLFCLECVHFTTFGIGCKINAAPGKVEYDTDASCCKDFIERNDQHCT